MVVALLEPAAERCLRLAPDVLAVGSIGSFDSVARRLAAAPGAAVVSVGHRLAPEHPFRAPLEEGLAVRALASDGRAFALAGDRRAVTSPP